MLILKQQMPIVRNTDFKALIDHVTVSDIISIKKVVEMVTVYYLKFKIMLKLYAFLL
jgi:hypothetical protein